jgi:hypothetical protein
MELSKAWNDIDFGLPLMDITLLNFAKESKTPLTKIKKSIAMNLFWGIVVSLIHPLLIIFIDEWLIKLGITIILIFSIKLIVDTYRLYKSINPILNPSNNLLVELKYQRDVILDWIRIQQKTGLIGYPFSITFGFLIGGFSASKLSAIELLNKGENLILLFGAIIVLTPLCYFMVKWMLNYTYKKDLQALNDLIESIEKLNEKENN